MVLTFAPRCSFRLSACEQGLPDAIPIADSGHWSRCLRAAEIVQLPPLAELPERDRVEIEADGTHPLLSINRVSAGHGGNAHAANEYYTLEAQGKADGFAYATKGVIASLYEYATLTTTPPKPKAGAAK